MKIYLSKSNSPYINQSIEYNLLKKYDGEDILLLWLNQNAIIIGRNQNIYNEINEEFVKEKNIKVARRHSGGGAVYHDMGNILFSLITKKESQKSYEEFLKPIIGFLNQIGVNAKFHGRNDVLVDDMKISGNAQFLIDDTLATHGTLLFDTDLTVLNKALITNKHEIKAKGIKSNKMRVTNIKNHIKEEMDSKLFVNELINYFINNSNAQLLELPEEILEEALTMSKEMEKYEWIYGKSPEAEINNKIKHPGGTLSVNFNIIDGKIQNMNIYGDFLSLKNIDFVSEKLNGINFDENSVKEILSTVDLPNYFGSIKIEEILKTIFY